MDRHYSILVHIFSDEAGQQREQKLINIFLEQGWGSSMLCQTRKEMKGMPYCLSHLKRKIWWRKRNSITCFWLGFLLVSKQMKTPNTQKSASSSPPAKIHGFLWDRKIHLEQEQQNTFSSCPLWHWSIVCRHFFLPFCLLL